jgi:hypothetical protein
MAKRILERFYALMPVAASWETVLLSRMSRFYGYLTASLLILFGIGGLDPSDSQAQTLSESTATTEQACSFGMAKGEASQSCHVPFPTGCLVANVPETDKPWTTISKGGKTFCRFDDKATDWKTKITGSCGRCKSDHCSVQFIVRFDCSQQAH